MEMDFVYNVLIFYFFYLVLYLNLELLNLLNEGYMLIEF